MKKEEELTSPLLETSFSNSLFNFKKFKTKSSFIILFNFLVIMGLIIGIVILSRKTCHLNYEIIPHKTNNPLWIFKPPENICNANYGIRIIPADDGNLYLTIDCQEVYTLIVLEVLTQKILWTYQIPSPVTCLTFQNDGTLYVITEKSILSFRNFQLITTFSLDQSGEHCFIGKVNGMLYIRSNNKICTYYPFIPISQNWCVDLPSLSHQVFIDDQSNSYALTFQNNNYNLLKIDIMGKILWNTVVGPRLSFGMVLITIDYYNAYIYNYNNDKISVYSLNTGTFNTYTPFPLDYNAGTIICDKTNLIVTFTNKGIVAHTAISGTSFNTPWTLNLDPAPSDGFKGGFDFMLCGSYETLYVFSVGRIVDVPMGRVFVVDLLKGQLLKTFEIPDFQYGTQTLDGNLYLTGDFNFGNSGPIQLYRP